MKRRHESNNQINVQLNDKRKRYKRDKSSLVSQDLRPERMEALFKISGPCVLE